MNNTSFINRLLPTAALAWPDLRLLLAADLAIDLGAANTRIFVPGRGVALNEPSVIALREQDKQPIAAGRGAKPMIGRAPASIRVVRPLRDGVIADISAATNMLTIFIRRAIAQPTLLRPRLLMCIPAETTPVERRALEEVARGAGARQVQFIEEPVAAAAGLGIATEAARAAAIIDIGAETVDVAVLSAGGLIHAATYCTGGRAMDQAITHYLREQHNLEIGAETAEMIKLKVGATAPHQSERIIEAGGRSLVTLMPARVTVTSDEIQTVLKPVVTEIVRGVTKALEELPPEVAADLLEAGVVLTGGAAQLPGLAEKLGEEIGLETRLATNPMLAAVTGAARIFWPETAKAGSWSLAEPITSGVLALPD
jgi:rod shape-determining protein MreB and related proteins